jgi:hypothetical protein
VRNGGIASGYQMDELGGIGFYLHPEIIFSTVLNPPDGL